ncbi:hypothetical protein ACFL48_00390 [Pseudomonadota bacterium]
MNKTFKYLVSAAVAAAMFATPAMACGGKACGSKNCDFKADKSRSCPTKGKSYKKGHHKIPGKSAAYVRKILKKADRIGLSSSQKKEVGKLLIAAETGAAKAHAEAQITVADFRSRLHGGKLSDSDLKAYTKRMGEHRSDKLMANLMASVKASRLLTDEQKAKLYSGKGYKGSKK